MRRRFALCTCQNTSMDLFIPDQVTLLGSAWDSCHSPKIAVYRCRRPLCEHGFMQRLLRLLRFWLLAFFVPAAICFWRIWPSGNNLLCLESTASAAAVCRFRQIVLGDVTSALAGMEAGVDPCPTGDRCRLVSRWIQVVLEVALAASHSCEKKGCKQRIARTHLPHGSREPDLGRAAYSWRTKNARLRHIGANGIALDAEGSEES